MHLNAKDIIADVVLIGDHVKKRHKTWDTWHNEPEIAKTIDEVECVSCCVLFSYLDMLASTATQFRTKYHPISHDFRKSIRNLQHQY